MSTKKTLWAIKSPLSKGKPSWVAEDSSYYGAYSGSVTTTAAGHVIASWMPYERTKTRSRVRGGALSKFSGAAGATVWEKMYTPTEFSMANTKMSAGAGETVYVPGSFKGKDSAAIAPLTMTSCKDGESASSIITHMDVSGGDGGAPAAAWAVVIGCGSGARGTFVEGNFLYVVGEVDEASTLVTLPAVTGATAWSTLPFPPLTLTILTLTLTLTRCHHVHPEGRPGRLPDQAQQGRRLVRVGQGHRRLLQGRRRCHLRVDAGLPSRLRWLLPPLV